MSSLSVDDDIDNIIKLGEERTAELNSKYEGLNFDDLNNFKSDSMLQWEGEDAAKNVCIFTVFFYMITYRSPIKRQNLSLDLLSLSKRERKLNYSVDAYYKETMRAGPSKPEKAPRVPRAPKQINLYVLL